MIRRLIILLLIVGGFANEEMGHSNPQTTMGYLRFPIERRLDDFPSLKDYIENRQNIGKNAIRGTKIRGTVYSNLPKLSGSIRN